jgi:hypothetical protein
LNRRALGLVVVSITMLLFISAFAHADLEPTVNSLWATTVPTINGTIGPGEWADAAVRNFTLEMRSRTDGSLLKTLNASFLVKNSWNNLYCAVQIFNDDYEAQDAVGRYNGLFMLFDDNHNHVVDVGDNGEGVTTWTGSPFYSHNDLYYFGSDFWDADFYAGKTNDGSMAFSHTNPVQGAMGDWTFEMTIPLVGTDGDGYDFAISLASLPKTVGYKIWFQEPAKGTDGVYPDEPAISKNILETGNGATFGNLIIHPLYTLTVITTPGGTTNPVPGQYQYSYGTIVSVQAMLDPGYMFDHWELDTINVGAANPYFVTMNENHTIKAFFKTIPSVPVGGISFYSLAPKSSATSIAYGLLFGLATVTIVVSRRRKK